MREWQPISTAPKDRRILVFGDVSAEELNYEVAEYGQDGQWWYADWEYTMEPTHWMELPEPPK